VSVGTENLDRVALREEQLEGIGARIVASAPRPVGGLLIGSIEAGELLITRLLPCPNSAPPEERSLRYEMDPRVVRSVESALGRGRDRIVGFFETFTGRQDMGSWAAVLAEVTDRETVVLLTVDPGNAAAPRARRLTGVDGLPRDLAVRLLPIRGRGFVCPE